VVEDEEAKVTKRELLRLARSKMGNPFVSVTAKPESVWVVTVTNFSCAEGFEIHGLTRDATMRSAAKVLECWKTEEPR
jgi:hypothetical protein